MTDKPTPPPLVSVILALHNSATAVRECLPALISELEALDATDSWECIAVDNFSSDDSREALLALCASAQVIESGDNLGFGAACNLAAAQARGRYLFFLNPDVTLDETSLTELISCLNSLPSAVATVGRMRNPDGSFQATCRNFPTRKNIFASRGSVLHKILPRQLNCEYTLPDYTEPTAVPSAAATCLLIYREWFERLGGFDERFFMFMEDTDLCLRIAESGGRIYFIPTAGGVHKWGKGSSGPNAHPTARLKQHSRSLKRFFQKHDPGLWTSVVLPTLLTLNTALKKFSKKRNSNRKRERE